MLTNTFLILFSMDAFTKGSYFLLFLLISMAFNRKKLYVTKDFFLLIIFSCFEYGGKYKNSAKREEHTC